MSSPGANPPPGDDPMIVVRKRHTGRWITGAVLVSLIVLLIVDFARNPRVGWSEVGRYLFDPRILDGIVLTVTLTFICMLLGIVLGVIVALLRISSNPISRAAAFGYVSVFRGIPVLVQLLFWFNLSAVYPVITLGIPGLALDANSMITPIAAAVLGLGLHEAAYMSEIIRGGIAAIDQGQLTAARALGLTGGQTLRRIVLPQAMAVVVPPTGNEVVGMLKTTSLVSVLAVGDLLYSAQLIYSANFQTIPLLIVASIWYLVLTGLFSLAQLGLERRLAKRRAKAEVPPHA